MAEIKKVILDQHSASLETWAKHLKRHHRSKIFTVDPNICQGCGGTKLISATYYGEEFCQKCVEKWKSGDK